MGQKVSPNGLRIGINKGWDSLWYVGKADFAKYLKEDNTIRKFIKGFDCLFDKKLKNEFITRNEKLNINNEGYEISIKAVLFDILSYIL